MITSSDVVKIMKRFRNTYTKILFVGTTMNCIKKDRDDGMLDVLLIQMLNQRRRGNEILITENI